MSSSNHIVLKETLNQFHQLNDDEFLKFYSICKHKEYAKNEFILESGDYNYGIYFIINGTVGLFHLVNGKQMFQNFFLSGEFAHELTSLASASISDKSLIALSSLSVFYIKRKDLLALYDEAVCFEKLGRKLLESMLKNQSEFSHVIQSLKPRDRYTYILENKPELIQAVSLTHLSSYLGIARETLSRIRAKKQ